MSWWNAYITYFLLGNNKMLLEEGNPVSHWVIMCICYVQGENLDDLIGFFFFFFFFSFPLAVPNSPARGGSRPPPGTKTIWWFVWFFFFFFFFGYPHGIQKFPGQGWNLHHSSDNIRFLTCWGTRELWLYMWEKDKPIGKLIPPVYSFLHLFFEHVLCERHCGWCWYKGERCIICSQSPEGKIISLTAVTI